MLERIAGLIQQALRPYDDKIAELVSDLEELQRRLDNIIRPGVVDDVHPGGKLVRVKSGRNRTPWIKWMAPAAGAVREYRCPSVGEQVALLNYGGGDNSTQTWALCGVWSDQFNSPAGNPNHHLIDWGDGMSMLIDMEAQRVVWNVPGGMELDIPDIHSTGSIRTDGDQIADTVSQIGHKHGGVVAGPASTEEPIK
ncbi:phage baseplate assembly protein V [Marinobacterium jannaschii]|uniref:phage baseplate assembly protein V n=1 Tax=Marinobacterium jannaschii TaxID=64970 RepID=UPI0006862933|nr:phage baseplate assembly protein V [Marinobacterium jannaschii]